MLTTILEKQGFSPFEARVYLATLELGQAPASRIADKLNENRVTVYSALEAMKKRDLILTVTKNKVIHYTAISPKSLLKTIQEKADSFAEAMPEFLALSALLNDKPSVQFYEGIEGLKLLYEDTLNYPDSTLKAFLGYEIVDKRLGRRLNYEYLPQRIKKKILAKVLVSGQPETNLNYIATNRKDTSSKYTELTYISDALFQLSNEINLYGDDKIALMMFGENEMMGLLIKSKMLYKTLNSLFDLTWKTQRNGQE
ncbi:MAG: hypothetical protein LBG59_04545 [Candidatus Peribacteria bacterium]|jgi:sugar-specific transcriptional regulator TrmB|nr:hypothetical protein [Candidatus Peribacteria bacterium]